MCDKEKLRQMLLLDMKHWSIPALKEALNYVDGMILSVDGDNFLWWWELRKDIRYELNVREAGNNVCTGREVQRDV